MKHAIMKSSRFQKSITRSKALRRISQTSILIAGVSIFFLFSHRVEASNKFWIAAAAGNFNVDSNWSLSSGGPPNTTAPGPSDVASFDGNGLGDCAISASANVSGISVASGYSGTITQASGVTITVGSSGYSQSAGTFNGSNSNVDINGGFTLLSTGVFNAPSGTLNFSADVTIAAVATFNPNGGTVGFVNNQTILVVPASLPLNNITINKNNGTTVFFDTTSTLVATGTVTLTDGLISNNGVGAGTIDAHGAVSIASTFDGGSATSATLLISGNAMRTVTLPVGAALPALTVNAPNVTLNASGAPGTITFGRPVNVQSIASFTNGAVNFVFSQTFTFGAGANLTQGSGDLSFNNSFTQNGGTFTAGSGAVNFTSTYTLNGGVFNAPSGTLNFSADVTIAAAATFNPNGGTVGFVDNQTILIVPASLTLNNITINKNNGTTVFFDTTSTLVATGTVTLTDGLISNNGVGAGTIDAHGAVSIASTFDGGSATSATLLISGNAMRTVTLPVGAALPALTVNAPNVTLNASGAPGTITFGRPIDVQGAASFTNGAVNFVFSAAFTFGAAGANFTPGSGDLTFNNSFTQNGGTFTPGSGALSFNSSFTLNGGTFNAPSGTLNFSADVTIAAVATFNPNGGTVAFVNNQTILVVPASLTLNNITINKNNGTTVFFNTTSTLVATGTVTLTDGLISNNGVGAGTIDAHGAVSIASTFDGGTATLLISGNAMRTVTLPVGAALPALTVNAPNVTLNASGAPGTITFGRPVNVQSAALFTNGAVNFVFSQPFTFGAANFTQGSGDLTFNNSFTQNGGTFTPGSGALSFNSSFTLNGGTFNAPSGTVNFSADVTIAAAATFNPNGGTVVFVDNQTILVVPASLTLNNITINKNTGTTVFFDTTSTLVATGTVTLTDGLIRNNVGIGTIDAHGAVFIGTTFDGGSANLTFGGTANQTFINNGGANPTGTWTVNKTTGAVTLLSDLILGTSQSLNITSGQLNQAASFNLTAGTITVGATGILRNFGTGDLTIGIGVSNDGTIDLNGGGPACGDADSIFIRSSSAGVQRSWSGGGTFNVVDVDVQDQAGSVSIIAFSSTNSGNNGGNWDIRNNCVGAPTEVTLESFTATNYEGSGVTLEWRTGLEVDNLGFNIYREEGGRQIRINPSLIAGSSLVVGVNTRLTAGWSYSLLDKSPGDTKSAQYWLEDVDLKGQSTWHGPFSIQRVGGSPVPRSPAALLSGLGQSQSGLTSPVELKAAPARAAAAELSLQGALGSRPAVKIAVKHEGWYRLSQTELGAVDFDTRVDPRLLQLFVDGRELPILVQGENDGSFDPQDAVEFYGFGIDSPFTDSHVYWLITGDRPGLRVNSAKFEGAPSSSQSFIATIERRDRTVYFSGLRNGEKENFFGAVIATNPVDQPLTLSHLARTSERVAELEIALQGVTFTSHHVNIELNGTWIGELTFDGQSQGTSRVNVAQSLLREGENVVRLTPVGGQSDVSLVDYVRVSYQHAYTADSGSLKLTAAGREQIIVDGFTSKTIRVFDVTDANLPQELIGEISQAKNGNRVSFSSPGEGQRTILCISSETRPASLAMNLQSSLRVLNASYVIITRRDFLDSLNPLIALHQRQGLSTVTIDIEDIYDEFSFGQKTPNAVREFLAQAKTNWKKKPRFVVFAGDASLDPKNYLGLGDSDFVPTKLIDTDFMETSSDDWFTDFNGDGIADIPTGRLPARTAEELTSIVSKIVRYGQSSPSDEALFVADVNDGFDFEHASAELISLIPTDLRITQVYRGRLDPEKARGSLFEALYRKQFLVNYVGHGSVNQWRGNLLTNADAWELRNDHLPIFVMMTCLNGYFHDAALDSLGESLIKAERGGAVAVWASSGMTMPADQALLNKELYRLLFNRDSAMTLGEAVMRAKSSSLSSDVRRTWILLGDPAMKPK